MNQENQENQNFNFFLNLKFIPQVILLSGEETSFQSAIDFLLKKIVCQKQFCQSDALCNNCQKIINNYYFDLIKYQFNKSNAMKKLDVINIINQLSLQSLEVNNPKICLLEAIEYSSLAASNSFLKFLENVPNNTFLILTTNKIETILPTIKSRCQIFNLPKEQKDNNLLNLENIAYDQQQLLLNLITKFINYDNDSKLNNNFLLIKKILTLKENLILFFQLLLELTQNKIIELNNLPLRENKIMSNFNASWKNKDQKFLNKLVIEVVAVINKINNVNNINLNLLLNSFFINVYQGLDDEKL